MTSEKRPNQGNADFEIDIFRPEDAQGIERLFRAVYGDGYPVKIFYDPDALRKANEEGRYYSIVARGSAGEIVGVHHLFRSSPYHRLYELGAGLIHGDYRQLGINKRMLAFIWDTWVPTRPEIEETFGEPVCNHVYMQRSVREFRHVDTAIEVALMPAEAYGKEGSASGRVATLMAFRCYRPRPQRIFLPRMYEHELRAIYARVDDARDLTIGDEAIPAGTRSHSEMTVFDFAQVARIAFHEIGDDFEAHLVDLETGPPSRTCVVLQVWIKLSMPWTGAAVEVLRRNGYCFGGPLPRWFDDDGLLMQKVKCDPNWDGIHIYADHVREMLAMVRADFARVRA